MNVVGVVAEYDPFHCGHAYHLAQARALTQADYTVVVMSGCFTQRGQGTVVSPAMRTQMALAGGADVVLELPVPWAVREAEHFALGAVSMLHRLGCVTHLAFGAEAKELSPLLACARLLESPTPAFTQALRTGLDAGLSHPAAVGRALANVFPGTALDQPNNVLALCYLRALLRLHAGMTPVLIQRQGNYHATDLTNAPLPSATAVRSALRQGAWEQVHRAVPDASYKLLRQAAQSNAVFHPQQLDPVLLYLLRTKPPEALRTIPGCAEGLENRLTAVARTASTREELLEAAKTKRYPYARLSRVCASLLLGLTDEIVRLDLLPPYARLLGFRRRALPLLKAMKKSSLPLLEKAADGPRDSAVLQADARAYDLWCLGAQQPAGLMWRQQIVMMDDR